MKQNLLFNRASAICKRLAMVLTMLLTVGIGQTWGATDVILWNGNNPSYQASTTEKTSTDGAIKWVNSAGNTYSNPTRIYSGNTLTISVANTNTTQITKIEAVCTSTSYAEAFGGTSVDVTGGGTASRSVSGSTSTITITGKATVVAVKMSAQSRVSKLTVTYESATPKQKYTLSYQAGENNGTMQVEEGANLLDALGELGTPNSCDATSTTFVGWTATKITEKTNTAPTFITSTDVMPSADFAVFAVFAENSGGTSFDGTAGGNFKIYAIVEGAKYYANGTGSKISSTTEESEATEYTFTKTSTGFTIKTGTSYITYSSSTNLGTSTTAYNWDISEGTNGSWRITSTANTSRGIIFRASTYNQFGGYSVGNASAGSTEYFDVEIGSSPSFSNYITSCSTETLVSVLPKIMNFWQSIFRVSLGYLRGIFGIKQGTVTYWVVSWWYRYITDAQK